MSIGVGMVIGTNGWFVVTGRAEELKTCPGKLKSAIGRKDLSSRIAFTILKTSPASTKANTNAEKTGSAWRRPSCCMQVIYLSSTLRSLAKSRTKSSATPFLISGRESLPSRRSDACTRLPNNTTARDRSSCREDQRKPWTLG